MAKYVLLVMSALACPILHAQPCTGVAEVLEREHARDFVTRIPDTLYNSAVASSSTVLSAQQQKVLNPMMKRGFSDAFKPASTYADLVNVFSKRCQQQKLNGYLSLSEAPLAAAMNQLALVTLRPEFPSELRTFAEGLSQKRPSESRLGLIQRIGKAQGATEMAMNVMKSSFRAWEGSSGGRNTPPDWESLRVQIWQQTNLANAFVYQSVSDEDLQDYVELLEKPSMKWFYQAYMASFSDVLVDRTSLAMRQIIAELQTAKNR